MAYPQYGYIQHENYGSINQSSPFPTAVNNIRLKEQKQRYNPSTDPDNAPYKPASIMSNVNRNNGNPFMNSVPKKRKSGPPPITSSHKQHIQQMMMEQQARERKRSHSLSNGGDQPTSSDEDGVDDDINADGQVVIHAAPPLQPQPQPRAQPTQPQHPPQLQQQSQSHINGRGFSYQSQPQQKTLQQQPQQQRSSLQFSTHQHANMFHQQPPQSHNHGLLQSQQQNGGNYNHNYSQSHNHVGYHENPNNSGSHNKSYGYPTQHGQHSYAATADFNNNNYGSYANNSNSYANSQTYNYNGHNNRSSNNTGNYNRNSNNNGPAATTTSINSNYPPQVHPTYVSQQSHGSNGSKGSKGSHGSHGSHGSNRSQHSHGSHGSGSARKKAAPPPLPKHKLQGYKEIATSHHNKHHNHSQNNASFSPRTANYNQQHNMNHALAMNNNPNYTHNHNSQKQQPPPQPVRQSPPQAVQQQHLSSEPDDVQFATSFEQFEDDADDILGIRDDELDNFQPVHYAQRFSMHANNMLLHKLHNPTIDEEKEAPPQSPPQEVQSQSALPQSPPETQSFKSSASSSKMKQFSSRKIEQHVSPKQSKRESLCVDGIAITQTTTDSWNEDRPTTPSRSSHRGSETRESDADFEVLARDKDYRPSIVAEIDHNDEKLQVSIDRYGFPVEDDDDMDEKEHRRMVKKENQRLLKWQDMVFSKKTGGTSAEADSELDELIRHWNLVKNHRKLKPRIRKGIPQPLRGTLWQNLSGARERRKIECTRYGSKTLYNDLKAKKKCVHHDQIWKDIARTFRKNLAFGAQQLANANNNANNTESNKNGTESSGGRNRNKIGTQKFFKNILQDASIILTPSDLERNATDKQTALYNVLKAFSLYRKDIGYCQGMQAVTALLLMHMTEEDAFWVLASLADDTKYQMDNLWRPSMPAIQLRFYQMERLVRIASPKLATHFEKEGVISASMYQASQWFITIFLATDMKFGTVLRVWDIYLNEGLKTVFRMGLGFLKYYEKQLLKSDFEEMLELFRCGASQLEVEEYVKVCFALRITHAQLAAFEKDFNRQHHR